jgi:hypothetical protein
MNTLTAKRLAEKRHDFLEAFLKQFYKEWDFGTGLLRQRRKVPTGKYY